jgi:CRISPR/Cas system-associated exonuclease Cas4 (RecB family)
MNPSLDELRKRPHLSVSALKMWLSCPRKYRLRYVDKAPASHRAIALVFGHAWHELIGKVLWLHQRGRDLDRKALREHFETALVGEVRSDGPPVLFEDGEDVLALVNTAMAMLEAFLAAVPLPERLLHVELPFSLELIDPETGEVLPAPLIGAIDAVVEVAASLELWEMKSGKRRWSEDAVLFDFQPTAYRIAIREITRGRRADPKLKLLVTTKATKPDVQVEDLVRTRADERDLMETAASIHRATLSECFHPVRSWMCRQCEYAEVCR